MLTTIGHTFNVRDGLFLDTVEKYVFLRKELRRNTYFFAFF